MATEPATLGCRLPGCGGPRSGVCINALPFDECPDVVALDAGQEIAASPGPETKMVTLPGGRSLDAGACDALLRRSGGTLVGLTACPEVGKTTLIATIYELLHRHRMARFGFAGSETLRGYEERCHLARLSSNAGRADTQRTSGGPGVNFTHLRISASGGLRDILFSDRSGEHFDNALSRPAEFSGFAELRRADAIVLLTDLTQLVDNNHVTVSGIRRLFMAMDQKGMLGGKKVLLVGTKADLAIPTPESGKAKSEFAAIGDELDRRVSGRFAIGRHIVACRAKRGFTSLGEGVEPLLAELLSGRPLPQGAPDSSWPCKPSELDRLVLGYRRGRQ